MEPHKKLLYDYIEMPDNIRKMLINYYEGTDQRAIVNDSYTRYPYLFDWQEEYAWEITRLDEWFFQNGAKIDDGYVIIHWNW
jgi:hypothetical protein